MKLPVGGIRSPPKINLEYWLKGGLFRWVLLGHRDPCGSQTDKVVVFRRGSREFESSHPRPTSLLGSPLSLATPFLESDSHFRCIYGRSKNIKSTDNSQIIAIFRWWVWMYSFAKQLFRINTTHFIVIVVCWMWTDQTLLDPEGSQMEHPNRQMTLGWNYHPRLQVRIDTSTSYSEFRQTLQQFP